MLGVWLSIAAVAAMATAGAAGGREAVDPDFLRNCAFVSVDLQEIQRTRMSEDGMPSGWKAQGFTAKDCNAATDYLFDVATPNAVKVADACRARKLPMIFLHWGFEREDGMDLDPSTRETFIHDIGPDPRKWPHHISDPTSRPAEALKVKKDEIVIAKSGQDAFNSSRIDFILKNLGVKNIIFVGGHTQGCLFRTATSANKLGYKALCVEDATWNARESTRRKGIEDSRFTYVVTTQEVLKLLSEKVR
jgi:nicotinamidase-related amidase